MEIKEMVQNKIVATLGFLACTLVSHTAVAQAVKVDPALPSYQKASGGFRVTSPASVPTR